MAWILVVLGVLVTAGGLWLLARSPAAGEAAVEVEAGLPRAKAVGETPWEVLMAPVESPAVNRTRSAGPFRMGLLLGLGVGMVVAGAIWAVAGNPTPSKDDVKRIAQDKYHMTVVDPAAASTAPAGTGTGTGTAAATTTPGSPTTSATTTTGAPAGNGTIRFTVAAGDAWGDVAQKLKDAGVIPDTRAFLTRLTELKADALLQQGTFTLTTNMSNDSVIQKLTGSPS